MSEFSTKTSVEAGYSLIDFFTLELVLLGGLVLLAFALIARKRRTH